MIISRMTQDYLEVFPFYMDFFFSAVMKVSSSEDVIQLMIDVV